MSDERKIKGKVSEERTIIAIISTAERETSDR